MENNTRYFPGSAGYSPASTGENLSTSEVATQQENIGWANSDAPVPVVPSPPNPSTGGQTGLSRALGWTTGLLPSRALRPQLTGMILVVPHDGPGPVSGPVGRSNRTGRLAAGVDALTATYLPNPRELAASFTRPSPLAVHMTEVTNG